MRALATAWQVKGQWVRTFVADKAVLVCTSSAIRALDPKTGKELAKIKWRMCGEPWLDDDLLWIPTTKGYDVAEPATLEITRTVTTPKPKGAKSPLAFYGTFDRVIDGVSYRVAKTNAEQVEFVLQAIDVASGKQRYTVPIAASKPANSRCAATADTLVLAILRDGDGRRIVVSLADGTIVGEQPFKAPKNMPAGRALSPEVRAIGPHLLAFPTAHVQPAVLEKSTWRTLDVDGEVVAIDDRIYGLGHRQIVRFDTKLGIVAKLALDTPPRDNEAMFGPDASVLGAGKDLLVVRRTTAYPNTMPYAVELTVRRADPMSFAWRGEPSTLTAPGGSRLISATKDLLVFAGPQGHLAVRGAW